MELSQGYIALMAVVAVIAVLVRFRRRENYLSYQIALAKIALRNESRANVWKLRMREIRSGLEAHLTSFWGFPSLAAAAILLNLVAVGAGTFVDWQWFDEKQIHDFLAVLWTVLATILPITFVVVVFLIQTILSARRSEEGLFRILIRESRILPIAFFGLDTILSIGAVYGLTINPVVHQGPLTLLVTLNLLLFAFNLFLIGFLYWRTFEFLAPSYVDRIITDNIRSRVSESVEKEITKRLGLIILGREAQRLGIDLVPTLPYPAGNLVAVEWPIGDKVLVVQDINLQQLTRAADRFNSGHNTSAPQDRILLTKGFGAVLSRSSPQIAYVPQTRFSPELADLLRSCFTCNTRSATDPLKEGLSHLKAIIGQAIQSREAPELQKLINVYVNAIESFLEEMHRYRVAYGAGAAQQTSSLDWAPIFQIERDLIDILRRALATDDWEMISPVIYVPILILRVSLAHGDHFIFNVFRKFPIAIYSFGYEILQGRSNRGLVLNRSWEYINEFCRHELEARASNPDITPDEYANVLAYVKALILTLNLLLKNAIDLGDLEHFRNFGDLLDALFADVLGQRNHAAQIAIRRRELENVGGNNDQRRIREQERPTLHIAYDAARDIATEKSMLWFGIGGWLVNPHRRQPSNETIQPFLDKVFRHFNDVPSLATTFAAIKQDRYAGIRFEWDHWDWQSRERPAGQLEAEWIRTDSWLAWFYVIRGLTLSPTTIPDTGTPIPPRQGLELEISQVEQICTEILNDRARWEGILSFAELEQRRDSFIAWHRRAVAEQSRIHEDRLIAEEISAPRWEQFKEGFLRAWSDFATLRNLIQRYGNFVDRTRQPVAQNVSPMGYDGLFPKAMFVEEDVVFPTLVNFVMNIVNDEDSRVLPTLDSRLAVQEESLPRLSTILDASIEGLAQRGYTANVILVGDWGHIEALLPSQNFAPGWAAGTPRIDIQGYYGLYNGIPVFLLPRSDARHCYVLDLQRVGWLIQHQMEQAPGNTFWLDIQLIDTVTADALLTGSTELWIDQSSGARLTRDEAVRRLRQQVRLKMLERLSFEVSDPAAGMLISIT